MRLVAVELVRLTLPLARPLAAAHGTEREREVVLVRAITDEAEGWGECGAGTAPTYTPEYAAGAADVLARFLAPALLEAPSLAAADVGPRLAHVRGHRMAKAALETAVLDAELRAAGQSLAARLGAGAGRVRATATVGLAERVDDVLAEVESLAAAGYRAVKLKIAPGRDSAPLREVGRRFGGALDLLADANGSYAGLGVAPLLALDDLGLAVLEQPFGPRDLAGHAVAARALRTAVGLDESVVCSDDVATVAALGAGTVVNLKAGRLGGPLAARAVHDACTAAGMAARGGGLLETGVGRAAALAVAALPGCTLPPDLAASDRYWAEDVTEPFTLDADGCLAVPSGPGIGVDPRSEALAGAVVERLHRS